MWFEEFRRKTFDEELDSKGKKGRCGKLLKEYKNRWGIVHLDCSGVKFLTSVLPFYQPGI